jgi:hypothetical protein
MEDLPTPPLIVNDLNLDLGTKEGRDQLALYLSCSFEGDTIPTIPSCLGGHITGERYLGRYCKKCNTKVTNLVDRAIDSGVWIAPPTGVKGFIHPEVWNVLSPRLTPLKSFSMLSWICDPFYPETLASFQGILEDYKSKHERGINYFIDHFDEIIEFIITSKLCQKLPAQDKEDIREFIRQNRDKVVQKHLPLPSQIFVVSEKTAMGNYADDKTTALLDAVYTITSTYSTPIALDLKRRQSHAARAIAALGICYANICTKFIGGKYGLVRRQNIGSRLHFTGRAVITSLSDAHHYEECHLPWAFAVQIYEPHLCGKLARRGFSTNDALAFLEDNTLQWNPLLRELFDELINESPLIEGFPNGIFEDIDAAGNQMRGLPIILQRNPSLTRGSAQQLYVPVIKDDVEDFTISLSNNILVAYNADFDGDELNVMVILDRKMLKSMSRFRAHLGARSLREPRTLSDNMKIHAPVAATWAHYVHHSEKG